VPGKPLFWVALRWRGCEVFRPEPGERPGTSCTKCSFWKAMASVGPGVMEIRIHETGEYRVLYVARFAEGVYVLHAFEKRTRQTRKGDIDLARRSLAEVLRHRRR